MKRSMFPIFLIVALLGLLVLLAGLQYKWLGQISDAERVRLEERLRDDTGRFAEDFNREIQKVFYSFQVDAENFENKNWNTFNKRFIYWKSQTQYPELAKKFYFLKNNADQMPLKYSAENIAFEEAIWTEDLRAIENQLTKTEESHPILEEQTALAMPIYEREDDVKQFFIRTKELHSNKIKRKSHIEMPEKYGFLIIMLDEEIIQNKILPDLVSKYFSDGESGNYKISVTDGKDKTVFQTSEEKIESPDSTAKLFTLKPNDFAFFSKEIGNVVIDSQIKDKKNVFVEERFTTTTVTSNKDVGDEEEVLNVDVKKVEGGKSRIAVFESKDGDSNGIWTLNIQHTSGSLEQFISNTRYRNLGISFGILSLLAVSIILIFISSQRARALAQRQLDFVSSVSHEFRTPLAVIYSAGENLSDGVVGGTGKISNYGNLIKREGKKLSGMVEQILEFAGANSGKRKYDFRQVNVSEIINEAIEECQPLIDEKGFELEKELSENLPIISADQKALTLAIQNLINNSLKYSNGNKWLKISAVNEGKFVKIYVKDRGVGISKKDLKQIFEPFYRSKEVVDEQISGNGLGLSLVEQIVKAHGGKISAESEIGKGSKFIIQLPLST